MARLATVTLLSFVGLHIALVLGFISLSTHYWITVEPLAANHTMPNITSNHALSNKTSKNETMTNSTTTVLSYSKGLWKICYENTTTVSPYHNKTIHHINGTKHNATNHTTAYSTIVYKEEKCFDVAKFNKSTWQKILPGNHTNLRSDMKTVDLQMKSLNPAKPTNHRTTVGSVLRFTPGGKTTHVPIVVVTPSNKTNHTSNHTLSSSNKIFNVSRYTYTIGFAFLLLGLMLYYLFLCADKARKSIRLAYGITILLSISDILMLVGLVIMGVDYKKDTDFKHLMNYELKLAWSFYVAAVSYAITLCSTMASAYNLKILRSTAVPYENIQRA